MAAQIISFLVLFQVAELSHDKGSMNLNTGYFESDGISPTAKLVENWTYQTNKIFAAADKLSSKSRTPPRPLSPQRGRTPPTLLRNMGNGDSWDLPPPKGKLDRNDRGIKRSFEDDLSGSKSQGLIGFGRDLVYEREGESRNFKDQDLDKFSSLSRDDYRPSSKIPSLIDMANSMDSQRGSHENVPFIPGHGEQVSNEMSTAVQLLAATMQLGGGNPSNMKSVLNALVSQQQKEKEDRRVEEERMMIKRRFEEEKIALHKREEALQLERRMEEVKREENRRREEMRRREEDRRREQRLLEERRQIEMARKREEEHLQHLAAQKRAAEEKQLRDIQIAAKLAMEQQKREQEERQRNAKRLQEQQAQMALMAVTKQVRDRLTGKLVEESTQFGKANTKSGNALDRINEKLKTDREKESAAKFDRNIAKDPAWAAPVILFSFLNRSNERKPLRGIPGQKVGRSTSKASDLKSRGQWIYNSVGAPAPVASLFKIKVRRPGTISEYETKVSTYNNRVLDLIDEGEALMKEGRSMNYVIRREIDDNKLAGQAKRSSDSAESKQGSASKSTANDVAKSAAKTTSSEAKKIESHSASGAKSKDLRETLKSGRARSKTPADTKPTSLSRPSTETKPRWDKSDESEDELLWDDDPMPMKITVDDDDTKSAKASVPVINMTQGAPQLSDSNANPAEALSESKTAEGSREQAASESAVDSTKDEQSNEATEATRKDGNFITLDDTAEESVKTIALDGNSTDFVTIDEAA